MFGGKEIFVYLCTLTKPITIVETNLNIIRKIWNDVKDVVLH